MQLKADVRMVKNPEHFATTHALRFPIITEIRDPADKDAHNINTDKDLDSEYQAKIDLKKGMPHKVSVLHKAQQ